MKKATEYAVDILKALQEIVDPPHKERPCLCCGWPMVRSREDDYPWDCACREADTCMNCGKCYGHCLCTEQKSLKEDIRQMGEIIRSYDHDITCSKCDGEITGFFLAKERSRNGGVDRFKVECPRCEAIIAIKFIGGEGKG